MVTSRPICCQCRMLCTKSYLSHCCVLAFRLSQGRRGHVDRGRAKHFIGAAAAGADQVAAMERPSLYALDSPSHTADTRCRVLGSLLDTCFAVVDGCAACGLPCVPVSSVRPRQFVHLSMKRQGVYDEVVRGCTLGLLAFRNSPCKSRPTKLTHGIHVTKELRCHNTKLCTLLRFLTHTQHAHGVQSPSKCERKSF